MSDQFRLLGLNGLVSGPAAKEMNIEIQVKAKLHATGGTVELTVEALPVNEADEGSSGSDESLPHFKGTVIAYASFPEKAQERTERKLIQHVWPALTVTLNDHAKRLGARNLDLPFSVSADQLPETSPQK